MVAALEVLELMKFLYKEMLFLHGKPLPKELQLANKECYIQGSSNQRVKVSTPMQPNPLVGASHQCSSCNLKNILIVNINFATATLQDAINTIVKFYPCEEFTLFHGSELIYEKTECLDEDEVAAYERNALKTFRLLTNHGQLQFILEPEGGSAIKTYFLDCPELKEPCLEQFIGGTCEQSSFEKFMVESNVKQKLIVKKTVDAKLVALQAQATCADISDSEEVIEEKKVSQNKKMDIEILPEQDDDVEELKLDANNCQVSDEENNGKPTKKLKV